MRLDTVLTLLAAVTCCGPALADSSKRDIRGIALGMPADQVLKLTTIACGVTETTDLACTDPRSDHTYKVMLSGGQPSVVLSVTDSFCSTTNGAVILDGLLKTYEVPKGAVRANPNGTVFDISPTVEGDLDEAEGTCKGGGKLYQFFIQDVGLMKVKAKPGAGAAGAGGANGAGGAGGGAAGGGATGSGSSGSTTRP